MVLAVCGVAINYANVDCEEHCLTILELMALLEKAFGLIGANVRLITFWRLGHTVCPWPVERQHSALLSAKCNLLCQLTLYM